MPLFKGKFFVEDDLLRELRKKFLEDLSLNEQFYHPDDIQRVKDNDWYVARYLLHQESNVDRAYLMLTESLKFRKEMGANTLRKKDFPKEFFSDRTVFIYNVDCRNHPIIAIRCKTHYKNEETKILQQQFAVYWLEKALRKSDWGVASILFDCTDSGVPNMDLDMIQFIYDTCNKYCPWCLGYFMVYNMPWLLSAFWNIVKQWIPEKYIGKICFVDDESIKKYITEDQLPICMGGTSTNLYEPKEGEEAAEDSE